MSIWFGRSVSLTAAVFLGALLSGCAPSSAAMGDVGGAEENKSPAVESPLAMAPTQPALGDDAKSASPYQITIDNFAFNPQKLTVPIGAKVTWVNRDDVPHTATSTKKPRLFDSKTLDTDDKYSHVFATAGTYEYFCAVHPHMTGQITVK
jgi:plastocyanin